MFIDTKVTLDGKDFPIIDIDIFNIKCTWKDGSPMVAKINYYERDENGLLIRGVSGATIESMSVKIKKMIFDPENQDVIIIELAKR